MVEEEEEEEEKKKKKATHARNQPASQKRQGRCRATSGRLSAPDGVVPFSPEDEREAPTSQRAADGGRALLHYEPLLLTYTSTPSTSSSSASCPGDVLFLEIPAAS